MGRLLVCLVCLCALPRLADANCCRLVKVDSAPDPTRVRVCALVDGADCATPRYEGEVRFSAPVSVCSDGDQLLYRELDPATNAYGAATHARCESEIDVEL
jgi:hypothetical protein